jgi:small subunit ribosomal protein S6
MRDYETTFILAPSLDADGLKAEVEAVKQFVSSAGGEVTVEKEWGRRRLQFPIRDCSEGIYHILRFSLDQSNLPELERHFRLNDNVLRHLVILDEGTPLDHVGQVSESEEHRDSRDRRHGPPPRRDEDSRPRPSAAPAAAPAPVAEAPVATAEADAPAPASTEGSDESAGEEKTSE